MVWAGPRPCLAPNHLNGRQVTGGQRTRTEAGSVPNHSESAVPACTGLAELPVAGRCAVRRPVDYSSHSSYDARAVAVQATEVQRLGLESAAQAPSD